MPGAEHMIEFHGVVGGGTDFVLAHPPSIDAPSLIYDQAQEAKEELDPR